MKSALLSRVALAVVLFGGLACIWRLQRVIDADSRMQVEQDELSLRSPAVVKNLSLEYAPLMAAIYWTRTVQYYGNKHRLHDASLPLLWPLLDITTTLDPQLMVAYSFGSTFLSDARPRGAGDPEHAVLLLERGLKANPGAWRLYQYLGNVYYFDRKDYLKASQAFEAGSRYSGAPPFMKVMAAKIAGEGESLETSYALWLEIYRGVTDKDTRQNAEEHLRMVKAEMDIREIDRLAEEYTKRTGRAPARILDLVQAGLLPGLPKDPDGYPYVIGESGKAELDVESPLLEDWVKLKK